MDYPYEVFAVARIIGGGNLAILSHCFEDITEAKYYIDRCAALGENRDELVVAKQIVFSQNITSTWKKVN
jgi:hypothetical protein